MSTKSAFRLIPGSPSIRKFISTLGRRTELDTNSNAAKATKEPKPTKSDCVGCRDDVYNRGCGGATECWSLKSATFVDLILVPLDEMPPHRQKPQKRPSCYRKPGYARYRSGDLRDGYVRMGV
jgi:hypothetical protein